MLLNWAVSEVKPSCVALTCLSTQFQVWEWVKLAVKPLPGCPSASFWSLTSLGLDMMGFCCARDLYLDSSLVSPDAAAILQEEQTKKPCRKFLQTGEDCEV